MDGTAKNLTVLLIYGLLVFGATGCAKRTQWPKWVPGSIQVEHVPGVVAPGERIESLKALAKTASTMDTAQREQVAQELAAEIRKEEDPILRGEIIHTLSFFPGPTCDSVLRLAVNDPDADIRILVCRIWGKRGDADAAKLLVGMLTSDADKDVRKAAARELGHSHDPAAVAALGGALDDPDPAMQLVAVRSLRESTGKDFGNDVDRWREYVKSGSVKPSSSPSFAERLRRWIY